MLCHVKQYARARYDPGSFRISVNMVNMSPGHTTGQEKIHEIALLLGKIFVDFVAFINNNNRIQYNY